MHRIDTSTKEVDKFGAGKHGFTEGDPSTGTAATQVSDDWLDAVQEEIVAPVEHTGILLKTSSTDTRDQLLNVMRQLAGLAPSVNYTERANPKDFFIFRVTSNNAGRIVAVGQADGGDAYIITSDDGGITWTERANPKNFNLNGAAWNGSLFVAVGGADGVDAYIVTSPDGTAWTERANPKNFNLRDVIWCSDLSLWIAVGDADGTDAYIVTSPDGTAWTERANPKNFELKGVAWNGTVLAAVGDPDGTDAYLVTSPDGIVWTERANPKNVDTQAITWVSQIGKFIAVGVADGADAYIITSSDGTTWTEQTNPSNIDLRDIGCNSVGNIIAVGATTGTMAYAIRSFNGEDWHPIYIPVDCTLYAAHYEEDVLGVWTLAGGGGAGGDADIVTGRFESISG